MTKKPTTPPVKEREIIFRAYDKAAKFLLLVNRIDWSTTGDKVDDAIWSIEGIDRVKTENGKDKTTFLSQEDFILMQFTGLHDKNGKEIYEGDIVKDSTPFTTEAVGEVVYEGEQFCLDDEYGTPMHYGNNYEVIGNIWENSNFLKGNHD